MKHPDPVQVFRMEAAELFEQIESGLLDLLHDPSDQQQIDAVFRGLHTLKGSGAMFGFEALAAFTHHCESAFDKVRKSEAPASEELIAAVLAAQDHMKALVETPQADLEAEGEVLLARLHEAVGNGAGPAVSPLAEAEAPVPAARPSGPSRWSIHMRLPENVMANGTNPLGLLDELRELGECTILAERSSIPDLAALDPTALHVGWKIDLVTDKPRSDIEDVFIFVMDDMELEIREAEAIPTAPQAVAPAEEKESGSEPQPQPAAPAQAERPVSRAAPAGRDAKHGDKAAENVRVPAGRLDELMDRVGELVIAQSRLSRLAGSSADIHLRSVSEDVERLSGELRDTMMVLRMVPITQLFGRFRRLIHDLARETGKQIELITEGENTEVDKAVIERLADPMVHLVRNSCDHGIETTAERIAAGKPAAGTIRLIARQSGGDVTIVIRDDGRGIDRQRVRAKAEAQGLIPPNAQMSDQELMQLIFKPGFSTAQQITNLSGRGVGMDVVKKSVEALRGTINITSTPGQGSDIALSIPLTLAIIDGLLVRVGAGTYVIPLSAVEECLELSPADDRRSLDRNFISLRDSLVPFIRLRELFQTGTTPDPHQKVVIISTGEERVGLVVDQIIGDHQTVIKSMSKLHHSVQTFSGATILGDGSVALILDVTHLVAAGQYQEAQLRTAI
ncbi:chemotaxis protein CheA [Allorhizobium undicola]|uniref:chemotaxis protein CheA n=1 Tax=Allorhizobium undicola TaxID=78527 RepID=UPI003D338944